jgi:uncharacterized protein (TIGR02266 family)
MNMSERATPPSPTLPVGCDSSSEARQEPLDQRATARVRVEAEVSLVSQSNFFVGLTRNLSNGGLFVATLRRLPVGTPVDVVLALPDGPLETQGRVRWARELTEVAGPGIGIKFDALSEQDGRRIEAFCAERAPDYFDVDE